ncbi:MAG: hypothetical protein CMJ88_05515, partial [Planctomycetes bacterium]|nr:hypothetical protein [Planctomycetota bacterium]
KLLIGGMGIEICGKCEFKQTQKLGLSTHHLKVRLGKHFEHGQQLDVSCWQERFRSVPVSQGAKAKESLTCASGNWLASDGHLGLANFACAACVQVVNPSYRRLNDAAQQELYFSASMVTEIFISKGAEFNGLLHDGAFSQDNRRRNPQRADKFLVTMGDKHINIQTVEDAPRCITSSENKNPFSSSFAPTKLSAARCEDQGTEQRFTSEALPTVMQSQAISQGLMPKPQRTSWISFPMKQTHSSSFWSKWWIIKQLLHLSVNLDCGESGMGAVGSLIWETRNRQDTSLVTACHPASMQAGDPEMKSIQMVKATNEKDSYGLLFHFPRDDTQSTDGGNDFMICNPGDAISKMLFQNLEWKYQCKPLVGMGQCHPFFTPDVDIKPGSQIAQVAIECARDELLMSILGENKGRLAFRYRYTCCGSAGLPISVAPKNMFERQRFDATEGIFCPESRDTSGRLVFRQIKSFKELGYKGAPEEEPAENAVPPTPAPPPPPPPDAKLMNIITEGARGVGGWGGWCTCPDGQKYEVGDYSNGCHSIACVHGMPGDCHKQHGNWVGRGRMVTCAQPKKPKYLGCYTDNSHRDLKHGPKYHAVLHGWRPETCLVACANYGYKYAGLQANGWCNCDFTYGTPASHYHKRSDSECGAHVPRLGGSWRNAIYVAEDWNSKERNMKSWTWDDNRKTAATMRCHPSHKFCLAWEGSKVYCYGSTRGCLWGHNSCRHDKDCLKYDSLSPKYTDGDKPPCPASGWRAEARCPPGGVKGGKNGKLRVPALRHGMRVAMRGGRWNRYCADEINRIRCNRNRIGGWERFWVTNAGSGLVALKGGHWYRWCADEINTVKCNRNGIWGWEKFEVGYVDQTRVALKGGHGKRFCADEGNQVKCNRNGVWGWEKFRVECRAGCSSLLETSAESLDVANSSSFENTSAEVEAAEVDAADDAEEVLGNLTEAEEVLGNLTELQTDGLEGEDEEAQDEVTAGAEEAEADSVSESASDVEFLSGNESDVALLSSRTIRDIASLGDGCPMTFGDRFIQVGDWRLGEVETSGRHFVMVHRNTDVAQVYRDDGRHFNGANRHWNKGFGRPVWARKIGHPHGITFGDRFIGIGKWRIGEVDQHVKGRHWGHASLSNKNGQTAFIWRMDARVFGGPRRDYNLWKRPLGPPQGIAVGFKFIQFGRWRLGDSDSMHASITSKDNHGDHKRVSEVWRADGTIHYGNHHKYQLWNRGVDNVCVEVCPGGKYVKTGHAACNTCNGLTRRRRAQSCSSCPKGRTHMPGQDDCAVDCPKGHYSPNWRSDTCLKCSHLTRRRRANSCTHCQPAPSDADYGYEGKPGSDDCQKVSAQPCPAGHYSRRRSTSCDYCDGQVTRSGTSGIKCEACPAGKISVGWQDGCVDQKLQFNRNQMKWEIPGTNKVLETKAAHPLDDDANDGVTQSTITIGKSSSNKKCVSHPTPLLCDNDAGNHGKRVNIHKAKDTFNIEFKGGKVCATRTDSKAGWGMDLRIHCWEGPSNFMVSEMSNFDGVFAGAMPGKKPKMPKKRRKPKLVELKAVKPAYKKECMDNVLPGSSEFKQEKMNEVGLSLPGNNPCNRVAGKWDDGSPIGKAFREVTGIGTSEETKPEGYSYESFDKCRQRARDRRWSIAKFTYGNFFSKYKLKVMKTLGGMLCGYAPSVEIAPFGAGIQINPNKICSGAVKYGTMIAKHAKDITFATLKFLRNKGEYEDCDALQVGFDRTFCDLHCISDAVKAGDKAILKTLEKGNEVIFKNVDNLLDYHVGSAKDEILYSLDSMKVDLNLGLVQRAKQAKSDLQGMFTEMKSLLSTNMDANSQSTAARALERFTTRFSDTGRFASNDTAMVHETISELAKESTSLLSTMKVAASRQVSTSGEVAQRTAAAMHSMNQALAVRHEVIGVYRASAESTKNVQRDLSPIKNPITAIQDDIQKSAATTLLLDLDRSWWTIREKLDAYLDAAEDQNKATADGIVMLEDYTTKCSAGFTELKKVHVRAQQADQAAHAQLHATWHSVEHELGLLSARIADSAGFLQLMRLDAAAADFKANLTTICGQGKEAKEAALLSVQQNLMTGLAKQTFTQLMSVFDEMDMLRSRFATASLKVPDNRTISEAYDRATLSFLEALDRQGDVALEVGRRSCNQDESKKVQDLEAAKKVQNLEAAMKAMSALEKATEQKIEESDRKIDQLLKLQEEQKRAGQEKHESHWYDMLR